jgi:predicted permease
MRESFNRLLDWFRRDRLEREMAEEIQFHRNLAERDARAAGLTPAEASYEAKRRFGNATAVAEESRDRWSLPRLDQIQQDVRYALRGLRRSPGFTTTAVVTLALGIGANVAMFSVVDQLMFKPYPYLRDPATARRIYTWAIDRGQEQVRGGEYTRLLDLRRFTTSFSQFAGFATQSLAVGFGEQARDRRIATVSGTFWDFFDAKPVLGRFFTPAEDQTPRGAEVSVLSYSFWQSEFGGSRDVIGKRLQVGHIPTTIVGVAPRGFIGIFDPEPAIYIPITLYAGSNQNLQDRNEYYTRYNWGWMSTMVRQKPGVSQAAADADVTQAFRRSWALSEEQDGAIVDLDRDRPRGVSGPLKLAAGPTATAESKMAIWVAGVTLIVLLIACANVANLSLARAIRRQREIAVRLALGVSRTRLTAQMLLESVLLAVIGGIAGVIVAHWGSVAIQRMLVTSTDVLRPSLTDWRMLGMVGALVVGAALVAGTAPAIIAGRGDLAPTLRGGSRGGVAHRSGLRGALLVMQGALSVVLLIGASLFVLSLRHVRDFRMGYDAEEVIVVGTNMRGHPIDSVGRMTMRRDLLARAQSTGGVQHAAITTSIPLSSTSSMGLYVTGIDSVARLGRFTYQVTTPDYFKAMGTRIVRGRAFTEADREGSALVVVVSESMAGVLWPGREAIGQCVRLRADSLPCRTVIGIAEDIVQQPNQMTEGKRFSYYVPLYQFQPQGQTYMVVKMRADADAQLENVRRSLARVMPGPSYPTVRTMESLVGGTQRSWRLGANLFVIFGVLALVVAAVGLYGVIGYNVSQRMHELGVRVALGAQSRDILGLVVGQGARFALAGVVVGTVLALIASRWVQPLLFEQSARDPLVFATVGGIMLVVALVACASPARRAAGADPNAALRSE